MIQQVILPYPYQAVLVLIEAFLFFISCGYSDFTQTLLLVYGGYAHSVVLAHYLTSKFCDFEIF